ncbi:glycosyltransferase [Frigoriglobus tundricola]|uniref:GT2/GT4 families glycosyltransferase n=1 Tax=Frigoriglobus tundricola TaxID=2774151 RepID=A0A6M5YKJ8_9BACT|nr:glycosyltransferase [Frigoriglobus tundricola]QJW94104.1 GT2/GT4 families glycosyltransferase [Frigoriglobus tundricola]
MKIGIDLRWLVFGEPDAPTEWLRSTLAALLARPEPHTYVLFHTVFNYHLFPELPPNVVRHTLPAARFYDELQDQVAFEGDFDLLLRCTPAAVLDRFPLAKQIVCVADFAHESAPQSLTPDALRERRRLYRAYQTGAGALAAPNEDVRAALLADPWTTTDVFVLPSASKPPASQDAVQTLLAAFERVARAEHPEARVRVSTPPLVSIVTPSFNQGAFVRQTIDSVLAQDYPHIDYRVVDGGSTDETVAVLKSYGTRVRWVSEKDRGQAHAINKGMAEARGEIRAYLNSDDLLRPGAVRRVVEHFQTRPACDLVYGRDAFIDAAGAYVGMYPTADYSFAALADGCCISQPATFWRKRLADRIGPFDESLHLVMDYDYWLRADRAGGTLEHIPDVLAHTRLHRQTKTSGGGAPAAFQARYHREVFAVCLRHAGFVSSRYVYGWLLAAVFNAHPWTWRYEEPITRIVQTWYQNRYRRGKKRWRAALSVVYNERQYVLPFLRRQVAALNPRGWVRTAPARVDLADDLWLGPEFALAHAGGPVRLAGVPARASVMRVYRAGTEIAAVELRAHEPADVCVEADAGPLRITFSDSEPLPDGRRVSFKLHGTTLFTERAVA